MGELVNLGMKFQTTPNYRMKCIFKPKINDNTWRFLCGKKKLHGDFL